MTVTASVALLVGLAGCTPVGTPVASAPTSATPTAGAVPAAPPVASSDHPLRGVPADARLYVIGDSWSAGYAADPSRTAPIVAAASLGWNVTTNAVAATGYARVSNPSLLTYEQRASRIPAGLSADVVLLQGSTNDEGIAEAALRAAVRATIAQVRARLPQARIVMLGPGLFETANGRALAELDAIMAGVAASEQVPYLSMVREGWITPANIGLVIDPVTSHPTVAGDAYLGGRLAADLRSLE